MRRKQETKIVEVDALKNADPSYVSFVTRGANNTPFRTLKEEDNKDMKQESQKSDGKGRHAEINKLEFSTEVFKSEDDVKTWLEEKGYEDFEIETTDNGFVVKGENAEDTSDVREIRIADGVTSYVGKIEKSEEVKVITARKRERTPAKKEEEKEKLLKFNEYDGYYDGATSLAEMFASNTDSTPIGFYELADAFRLALYNVLDSGDTSKIYSLAQEYADALTKLVGFMGSVTKTEEDKAVFKSLVEKCFGELTENNNTMKEETKKSEDAEVEEVEKTESVEEVAEKQQEEPQAEKVEESKSVEEEVEATEEKAEKSEVTLEAIAELLAKSSEATKEAISEIKKEVAEVKESVGKSEDRINEIENVRPARKSVASDDSKEEEVKKEDSLSRNSMARKTLGFFS
jgi:hypothetical protein